MIKRRAEFEEIIPSWQKLWPNRDLNPYSSMLMKGGLDVHIQDKYKHRCWLVELDSKTVGVMAGHKSETYCYRTRGLWVDPDFRGQGVAQQLFSLAQNQAEAENCRWLWSYPRLAALPAYMKAGYVSFGEPDLGEFDHCVRARKDLSIITTTVWRLNDNPLENLNWISEIDSFERMGILLGQNEEVRANFIHITQHWLNQRVMSPHAAIGECEPVHSITGNLEHASHVL